MAAVTPRTLRFLAPAGALTVFTAAGVIAQEKLPRRELVPLEQAFAEAVSRVSQPAAVAGLGGAEACRGYRLPGFGTLFVVSPRYVPERMSIRREPTADLARADRELGKQIAGMEEALKTTSDEERKEALSTGIQKATAHRQLLRQRHAEQQQLEAEMRAFAEQVQAMHFEAEKARQQAEQAMQQMQQQIGAPMEFQRVTDGGMGSASAVPPWVVWMQSASMEDRRTPEQVIEEVRTALMSVLEARGADAQSLEPEEVVAVAVDFYRSAAVGAPATPSRTLVVRAPKRVLDLVKAGQLTTADARKQFQVAEY
jgi:hypothetical protein